jgi:hypothetical protein
MVAEGPTVTAGDGGTVVTVPATAVPVLAMAVPAGMIVTVGLVVPGVAVGCGVMPWPCWLESVQAPPAATTTTSAATRIKVRTFIEIGTPKNTAWFPPKVRVLPS